MNTHAEILRLDHLTMAVDYAAGIGPHSETGDYYGAVGCRERYRVLLCREDTDEYDHWLAVDCAVVEELATAGYSVRQLHPQLDPCYPEVAP
jgi:hypothetical protein